MEQQNHERLIKKILEEAEREADGILTKARETAKRLVDDKLTEAKRKGEEEARQIIENARLEAKRTVEVAVTNARIRSNWAVLAEKQRIVEEVFEEVKRRIKAMKGETGYRRLLRELVKDGAVAANGGDLEVLLAVDDAGLPLDLNSIAGEVEEMVGNDVTLRLSKEPAPIVGGAILRSADGKLVVDNSIEAVLERKRKSLEPRLLRILFEG